MTEIQIHKCKSISFNEYLYDIITNTTSSFATGWGFFVSIDDHPIQIKQNVQTNYIIKPIIKPVIKRKYSIKSFQSTSNLHSSILQATKLHTSKLQDIDEITETMFEMDLSNPESKYDNNKDYVVSKYAYNITSNIYNNIKSNIYIIGTFILYGGIACIKTVLTN